MDRRKEVKYSIREVFGYTTEEDSPTGELLEAAGLDRSPAPGAEELEKVSRVIERAIETGSLDTLVEGAQAKPKAAPARDDVALQRWREMAGLASRPDGSQK